MQLELATIELDALRTDNDHLRGKLRRLSAAYTAFDCLLESASAGKVYGCGPSGSFDLDVETIDLADAEIMVRQMMALCGGLQGVIKPLLCLNDTP